MVRFQAKFKLFKQLLLESKTSRLYSKADKKYDSISFIRTGGLDVPILEKILLAFPKNLK